MTTTNPDPGPLDAGDFGAGAIEGAARADSAVERERAVRKRELALGYRLFGAMRWGDLGDGHITARDPARLDHFWVLRGGLSFHKATVHDLVLIGPGGEVVVGNGGYNTTSYFIHGPIHDARPDVVAAAHVHTGWGTPFAAERRLLEPISQEACIFHDDHSLFDDEEVQILGVDGGKRIAASLGRNRAVILANHGLLATGASVGEAIATFVTMERVAEVAMKARGAKPISAENAGRAKAGLRLPDALAEGFDFLVDRYIDDPAVVD